MEEIRPVTDYEFSIDTNIEQIPPDTDEETRLKMLNDKYLPVLVKISELNELKKDIDDKLDEIKKSLGVVMDGYNVKSLKNSVIRITRVDATTSTSFDTTKFKKDDPELYEELFKKYNKTSNRSAYTKIET